MNNKYTQEEIEQYKKEIYDGCKFSPKGFLQVSIKLPKYKYLLDFIENQTPDKINNSEYSISTKVHWILNNMTDFPKCKGVNCEHTFEHKNVSALGSYPRYCSVKCERNDPEILALCNETFLKNFGTKEKLNELKQRKQRTLLEKYGSETYRNPEKAKRTSLEKYGTEYPQSSNIVKEKQKETCLKNHGVPYYFISKDFKEQSEKTKLEKYGNSNYNGHDKFVKTCLEKFGCETPLANIQKREIGYQTKIKRYGNAHFVNSKKAKETSLKKYGKENYMQTKEAAKLFKQNESERIQKMIETKRKHNTFNKSSSEDKVYEILYSKFPDIIRQYKSKQYPFCCDFYIPSIDTYIEFQGGWLHGNHPFNENNGEDIKQRDILLEKGKTKKFYLVAADTWTRRDVIKRNIAIANNLKYIEFWNVFEAEKWINK